MNFDRVLIEFVLLTDTCINSDGSKNDLIWVELARKYIPRNVYLLKSVKIEGGKK